MRLTINLDEDLYAMARSHAIASKMSISKAVCDLLRRKTPAGSPTNPPPPSSGPTPHPLSGFPVVRGAGGPITNEDVARMEEEEDARHWQAKPTTLNP